MRIKKDFFIKFDKHESRPFSLKLFLGASVRPISRPVCSKSISALKMLKMFAVYMHMLETMIYVKGEKSYACTCILFTEQCPFKCCRNSFAFNLVTPFNV